MNNLYNKAFTLRQKGHSYNEINQVLKIPKSTLSGWFSKTILSEEAQKRILSRVRQGTLNGLIARNKMQTIVAQKKAREIQERSKKEIASLSKRDLMIIGTVLYWAEGYKRAKVVNGLEITHHAISFTNSDPFMVQTFVAFVRKVMGINKDKIRLQLRLFKHIDEQEALLYWSKITGLSKNHFGKVSYVISRSSLGKRPFQRLPFGTLQVRISDTAQFHRLMGWLSGIKMKLADLAKND
ncbi:hypothetical protein KW783_01610 [Candidatus Parcubacteria bacterium]|nr:hypothetical protein [Candidatus Parcubacteria bacterium]